MANSLSRQEVKRFALIGARARLDELRAEIASLVKAFPELAQGAAATRKTKKRASAVPAGNAKRGRKRRAAVMSDDQKKAVSERMKKYWAGRRKEKPKKA